MKRAAPAKTTSIAPPLSQAGTAAAWPHGLTHDPPGALTIHFGPAEELLGRVLALAEDAAADYAAF